MSEHNIDQRKAYVAEVVEKINDSASVVLVDYRGINVSQDTAMRKALREAGVKYHVIKNSALSRAFEQTGLAGYDEYFAGPTAAAFGPKDDPVAPCRILADYAGKTPMTIKCGVVEGKKFDENGVKALASIPEKPVLLAQLLGLLTSPMRSLAIAISEVAKQKA
ncbi:MAG: 50S ribosomal protein L10 [Clostridiales bacterium]|nr:50S ribosomal protein L10 [Clostridiales bacterium]